MDKPSNIIDLNPFLKEAKIREFNEKFLAKLRQGSEADKIVAAQSEQEFDKPKN